MTLNRTIAPALTPLKELPFIFPEKITLGNGIPVYKIHDPSCEIVKIELQFEAGKAYGTNNLQAFLTNSLMASGTSRWTSKEIVDKIDHYGAYFEHEAGPELASFSIYSLRRYAGEVLKIVAEVLTEAVFPEDELQTALKIEKQKYLIRQEKVSHMAHREFSAMIYGPDHVYGRSILLEHYDQTQRQHLVDFYNRHYKDNLTIYIAGHVDNSILNEMDKIFVGMDVVPASPINQIDSSPLPQFSDSPLPRFPDSPIPRFPDSPNTQFPASPNRRSDSFPEKKVIQKKDAVQSAIRIGCRIFNRQHEDFAEMQVLSTVFGGYFGSRLMTNLREDKGYTYGVGAGMQQFLHSGNFYISTEVGRNVTKAAVDEIFRELNILRTTQIPEAELDTVRHYMLGQILRSTDGPLASMDRFQSFHMYGLGEKDYYNWVRNIIEVQPQRLMELANKWLNDEQMSIVIAGAYE